MSAVRASRRTIVGVFVILFGSYAFFWHGRDWNSASRLMLTYALVDRGTVRLDGLDRHTRDIAEFRGHYYTDKLPGFSLLAVPSYALAKAAFKLPPHPLYRPPFQDGHWPADYWVTLGTSGILTALTGAFLVVLAADLGCGPRRSALVGLAYGLATPAYVYATMSYGHQPAAFCLLASFALLWRPSRRGSHSFRAAMAGLLAAAAAVVELQVGPISALLGFYLFAQVIRKEKSPGNLAAFAAGAFVPTLALLSYNMRAFGSPWQVGYFHERLEQFARLHSARNPLGLRLPDWSKVLPLLWGRHRGLLFYAPILILALPGWIVLALRRKFDVLLVSALACLAMFLVNLSYPNWDGGWCTGPRLLVPMLPFAMLPVAALLAVGRRTITPIAVGLAIAGGVMMLLFQGVGGRLPQDIPDPLTMLVWPLWRGDPLPPLWQKFARFDRTLVSWRWPESIAGLKGGQLWRQFVPLVFFQVIGIALIAAQPRGQRETDIKGPRAKGAMPGIRATSDPSPGPVEGVS